MCGSSRVADGRGPSGATFGPGLGSNRPSLRRRRRRSGSSSGSSRRTPPVTRIGARCPWPTHDRGTGIRSADEARQRQGEWVGRPQGHPDRTGRPCVSESQRRASIARCEPTEPLRADPDVKNRLDDSEISVGATVRLSLVCATPPAWRRTHSETSVASVCRWVSDTAPGTAMAARDPTRASPTRFSLAHRSLTDRRPKRASAG